MGMARRPAVSSGPHNPPRRVRTNREALPKDAALHRFQPVTSRLRRKNGDIKRVSLVGCRPPEIWPNPGEHCPRAGCEQCRRLGLLRVRCCIGHSRLTVRTGRTRRCRYGGRRHQSSGHAALVDLAGTALSVSSVYIRRLRGVLTRQAARGDFDATVPGTPPRSRALPAGGALLGSGAGS